MIIDPEVCIDCGVCLPECPIGAIVGSVDESPEWAKINAELTPEFKTHPKVTLVLRTTRRISPEISSLNSCLL